MIELAYWRYNHSQTPSDYYRMEESLIDALASVPEPSDVRRVVEETYFESIRARTARIIELEDYLQQIQAWYDGTYNKQPDMAALGELLIAIKKRKSDIQRT